MALAGCKKDSSVGVDKVSYSMVERIQSTHPELLASLFTHLMYFGRFPQQWKLAIWGAACGEEMQVVVCHGLVDGAEDGVIRDIFLGCAVGLYNHLAVDCGLLRCEERGGLLFLLVVHLGEPAVGWGVGWGVLSGAGVAFVSWGSRRGGGVTFGFAVGRGAALGVGECRD